MAGKCPKCEKVITSVTVIDMPVHTTSGKGWKGAAFICPFCSTVLGVGIDPHAMKTETVADILTALQG